MAEAEARVNEIVEQRAKGVRLTLTQMEDLILEVRQKLGERMIELLVQQQESQDSSARPRSAISGKPLHSKGKKRQRSRRD